MPTRKQYHDSLVDLNITRENYQTALLRLGITPQTLTVNGVLDDNKIDEIVSSLRSFQNSRFGNRTGGKEMNIYDIFKKNSSTYRTRMYRSTQRKTKVPRPAWFLIDMSGTQPIVIGAIVHGLSRQQWIVNWKRNAPVNAFPLAQITANARTPITANARTPIGTPNYVQTQMVGKVCGMKSIIPGLDAKCKTGGSLSNSKNIRNQYTYLLNGQVYTAYKGGSTGLAIAQIAKIIKGIGRSNFKNQIQSRADFVELKRNGDYGEVFTLYYLNSDDNTFILKPGDDYIAREINNTGTINPAANNLLNIAQNLNSYFYQKGCFWSTDRPSIFLCILLNIPYVRSISKGNMIWYCLDQLICIKMVICL